MGTLAELSNSVSSLIQAHPSMKADLDILLSQIANLDVPEIGIQIDEGRIQLVERFNDAPFKIYVHEHGVEGTEEKPCELVWNNGRSEPVIMSTYRSEEHTSELQSLMRISYAVFCLKKKKKHNLLRNLNIILTYYTH